MVRPIGIVMIFFTMHPYSNMLNIIKEEFETQKLPFSNIAILIFHSL